jgi:hypothetical protein
MGIKKADFQVCFLKPNKLIFGLPLLINSTTNIEIEPTNTFI